MEDQAVGVERGEISGHASLSNSNHTADSCNHEVQEGSEVKGSEVVVEEELKRPVLLRHTVCKKF